MMKWLKKSNQYRFCLPQGSSPTYSNLSKYLKENHWLSTRFISRSHFNERHFNFDIKAAEQLEFKHLVAQLAAQYCPQLMPKTYCINDQNWLNVLNQIHSNESQNAMWILKPALLNNGKHIKIFSQLNQLEEYYLSSNRLGGDHVLQQYLLYPHLLKGHKYSIRMFVIVTNYAGVYLYPYGYFNVALHPYEVNHFTDLRAHLTNEHLQSDEVNVIQIPTQRFDFFAQLYPVIKMHINSLMNGLQNMHEEAFICRNQRALAIFGFDFMVDQNKQLWFLEANHGPCFPTQNDHPLQNYLYQDFWHDFISSFVLPIAKYDPLDAISYQSFEKVISKKMHIKELSK